MTARDRYLVAAVVALAALLRLAMLVWLDPVVTSEGAFYLRLAQNLRDGTGYQGIWGELDITFTPLLPLLIALVSHVAGGVESAARVISLLLGVATILPLYGISAELGGKRAGLIGAALGAVHGVLVALSVSTYSECTYIFLIACAIYWALRTATHWNMKTAALSGAMFGLAYLVRPESLVYLGVMGAFAVFTLARRGGPPRVLIAAVATMLVVAAATAAPYVAWLSETSGYLRFEGKSGINGLLSERLREGLSYQEATRGLGPALEPVGAFLPRNQRIVQSHSGGARSAISTMLANVPARTLAIVHDVLATTALGGLPFVLLAILGFIISMVRPGARSNALLFALFGASYPLVLLTIEFRWTRYLFPVVILLLPWAAIGVATVAGWVAARLPGQANRWALAISLFLIGTIGVTSARGTAALGEFTQLGDHELRDAGRWLAGQGRPDKFIATANAALVYYARARMLDLPWSSGSQAEAYLRKLGPEFLVLRDSDVIHAPYAADWIRQGVPGECADAVRVFKGGSSDVLRVYRWHCPATDREWLDQWCRDAVRGVPVCAATPKYEPASLFPHP